MPSIDSDDDDDSDASGSDKSGVYDSDNDYSWHGRYREVSGPWNISIPIDNSIQQVDRLGLSREVSSCYLKLLPYFEREEQWKIILTK